MYDALLFLLNRVFFYQWVLAQDQEKTIGSHLIPLATLIIDDALAYLCTTHIFFTSCI